MADAMKRIRPMADAMKRGRSDAMKRGRPCLILVRRRHEPIGIIAGSPSFRTDTTRMRRMIVIAFFQQLAVLSSALMQLHGLLFLFLLIERGIFICWRLTLRGREIYLLKYKELKLPAVLSLA